MNYFLLDFSFFKPCYGIHRCWIYWLAIPELHASNRMLSSIGYLYQKVFLPEFTFLKVCYGSLRYWIYLLDSSERLHVLIPFWEMVASSMQFFARIYIFFSMLQYSPETGNPNLKVGRKRQSSQGAPVATINTEFLKQGGKYYGKKH